MPSEDKLHKVTRYHLMQLRWICSKVCSAVETMVCKTNFIVLSSKAGSNKGSQLVVLCLSSCNLFIWYSVGPLITVTLYNPDALQSKRES